MKGEGNREKQREQNQPTGSTLAPSAGRAMFRAQRLSLCPQHIRTLSGAGEEQQEQPTRPARV